MKHVGTNSKKKLTTVKLCLMAGERKKELSINGNLNRHVKRDVVLKSPKGPAKTRGHPVNKCVGTWEPLLECMYDNAEGNRSTEYRMTQQWSYGDIHIHLKRKTRS